MSDTTQDIVLWILALLLTILPLGREIAKSIKEKKTKKQQLFEIKKHRNYIILLSLISIAFVLFGTLKIIRDSDDKTVETKQRIIYQNQIDSLNSGLKNLLASVRNDSLKNREFENRLLSKFNIKRDSILNQPVKMVFNTHINRAENVSIGPK